MDNLTNNPTTQPDGDAFSSLRYRFPIVTAITGYIQPLSCISNHQPFDFNGCAWRNFGNFTQDPQHQIAIVTANPTEWPHKVIRDPGISRWSFLDNAGA